MTRLAGPHARLYLSLRTAHLERFRQLPPAAVVYRRRRYDFDESLAEGLDLVRASPLGAARLLARSPLRVLEVNEPLMTSSLRTSAVAIAAVRLRGLLTRRRTALVGYAIVNADPWAGAAPAGVRPRARRALERRLARFVWHRLDRVCFGTADAERVYDALLRPNRAERTVLPALPVPLDGAAAADRDPDAVLFLGGFLLRKGVDRVLAAWPLVRRELPGARLTLLGKGPLEADVLAAAAGDPSMTVRVDPPRPEIRETLLRSAVLVLPSQPADGWREQVGLPIVEGLAAGCAVVTTSETGLAGWLAGHGHAVVAPGGPAAELAAAIVAQLRAARPAADVVAALPAVDGRLAADAWMFGRQGVAAPVPAR